jgi:succinate dehydrogenase flavin-adding protein (antitoxin of CptAB toxin-antitoxin module)
MRAWLKANGGPVAVVVVGLSLAGYRTPLGWLLALVGVLWWFGHALWRGRYVLGPFRLSHAEVRERVLRHISSATHLLVAPHDPDHTKREGLKWERRVARDLRRFDDAWLTAFGEDSIASVSPTDAEALARMLGAKAWRLKSLVGDTNMPPWRKRISMMSSAQIAYLEELERQRIEYHERGDSDQMIRLDEEIKNVALPGAEPERQPPKAADYADN